MANDSNERLNGFCCWSIRGEVLTELNEAVIAAIVLLPPKPVKALRENGDF